jgi:hypothetical protein
MKGMRRFLTEESSSMRKALTGNAFRPGQLFCYATLVAGAPGTFIGLIAYNKAGPVIPEPDNIRLHPRVDYLNTLPFLQFSIRSDAEAALAHIDNIAIPHSISVVGQLSPQVAFESRPESFFIK